jgi:hypothetical protein
LKVKVAEVPEGMVWAVEPEVARVKSVVEVVEVVELEMVRVARVEVLGWKLESPE